MLFNSFQFLFFFVTIVPLYYATPFRFRWIPLLAGSYFFYMCWHPAYILLILMSTSVDYFASLGMSATKSSRSRTVCLITSVGVNLGLLFVFKYYNFFSNSITQLLEQFDVAYRLPHSEWLLPVGISFYTFQTLSYSVDVYRKRIQPERHLGKFALYVAFFPQLVAGPIERAGRLLPQFSEQHQFNLDRVVSGLRLMLWGLFKKVVIADRLADYVNRIYDDPTPYSGATLLLATYFFAFQIYCDFSGYSDIAIGAARVLGFRLMQNFNLPYLATSIPDFWRRWHISLSTWFRDYVYIPLGGSQTATRMVWARNVLVVFVLSGLWHGANWTFAVWGLLHAVFFFLDAATREWRQEIIRVLRMPAAVVKPVSVFVTFHLVVISWVFFRARNLSDANHIIRTIILDPIGRIYLGPSQLATAIALALLLFLVAVQLLQSIGRLPFYQSHRASRSYVRWTAYVGLVLAIAMLGKTSSDFIYFQF